MAIEHKPRTYKTGGGRPATSVSPRKATVSRPPPIMIGGNTPAPRVARDPVAAFTPPREHKTGGGRPATSVSPRKTTVSRPPPRMIGGNTPAPRIARDPVAAFTPPKKVYKTGGGTPRVAVDPVEMITPPKVYKTGGGRPATSVSPRKTTVSRPPPRMIGGNTPAPKLDKVVHSRYNAERARRKHA